MYADHTLTPKEAIRLCALGSLALQPMRYGDLATCIRHFISRVVGPTPEIMGHSLELLRYEGLVEALSGSGDEAVLGLTDDGHREMQALLVAGLRPASSELNSLIVALKFRFMHLLPLPEQQRQVDMLIAAGERELARLEDLHAHHASDGGYLPIWLDQHRQVLKERLRWLEAFGQRLEQDAFLTAESVAL